MQQDWDFSVKFAFQFSVPFVDRPGDDQIEGSVSIGGGTAHSSLAAFQADQAEHIGMRTNLAKLHDPVKACSKQEHGSTTVSSSIAAAEF